jgi:hypothetical protein
MTTKDMGGYAGPSLVGLGVLRVWIWLWPWWWISLGMGVGQTELPSIMPTPGPGTHTSVPIYPLTQSSTPHQNSMDIFVRNQKGSCPGHRFNKIPICREWRRAQVNTYMPHKILRQFWPWEQIHVIKIRFTIDLVYGRVFLRIFTWQIIRARWDNIFSRKWLRDECCTFR